MIELLPEWIRSSEGDSDELRGSVLQAFRFMSDLITEHVDIPTCSRLRQFLPKLTRLFLPLYLTRAALEYDATTHFLARNRVPPTYKKFSTFSTSLLRMKSLVN
ncbi:hypothetical protein PsorP6_011546 [Peronosclerospora sorghi]|uniref:Uncharacterized protein n=1 Tax=Peronosclerospora sorghi TaxID=230839 RepID=A0ACC0WKC9_9STRA|nr:hypothetical protein PsorP6_011546 [Peronosclerospora sorghi]